MQDWSILLTSTVISAIITGIISVTLKGWLDQKLEINRQIFEKDKMNFSVATQKELEKLKSSVNQVNNLLQKNLEHYHSVNQIVHNKKIEAIDVVWNEYLLIRQHVSPIINFFSLLAPTEYMNFIDELEEKDPLNLKSVNDKEVPSGLDTVPLINLEKQRIYLGEVIYYKFRSSIIVLLRLWLIYNGILKKKTVYLWNEDQLLIDHLSVVFSDDTLTLRELPVNLDNPLNLLSVIAAMELELNKVIERVILGEVSADLSLKRLEKLNRGFK
jgi:hypothetical protein